MLYHEGYLDDWRVTDRRVLSAALGKYLDDVLRVTGHASDGCYGDFEQWKIAMMPLNTPPPLQSRTRGRATSPSCCISCWLRREIAWSPANARGECSSRRKSWRRSRRRTPAASAAAARRTGAAPHRSRRSLGVVGLAATERRLRSDAAEHDHTALADAHRRVVHRHYRQRRRRSGGETCFDPQPRRRTTGGAKERRAGRAVPNFSKSARCGSRNRPRVAGRSYRGDRQGLPRPLDRR